MLETFKKCPSAMRAQHFVNPGEEGTTTSWGNFVHFTPVQRILSERILSAEILAARFCQF